MSALLLSVSHNLLTKAFAFGGVPSSEIPLIVSYEVRLSLMPLGIHLAQSLQVDLNYHSCYHTHHERDSY